MRPFPSPPAFAPGKRKAALVTDPSREVVVRSPEQGTVQSHRVVRHSFPPLAPSSLLLPLCQGPGAGAATAGPRLGVTAWLGRPARGKGLVSDASSACFCASVLSREASQRWPKVHGRQEARTNNLAAGRCCGITARAEAANPEQKPPCGPRGARHPAEGPERHRSHSSSKDGDGHRGPRGPSAFRDCVLSLALRQVPISVPLYHGAQRGSVHSQGHTACNTWSLDRNQAVRPEILQQRLNRFPLREGLTATRCGRFPGGAAPVRSVHLRAHSGGTVRTPTP